MMITLLRLGWLTLSRDRVALLLTFVLPIAFFSVFAVVFGRQGSGSVEPIAIVVADLDRTDVSERMLAALRAEAGLRVREHEGDPPRPFDRASAEAVVRSGKAPAAVVLLPGFSERFASFEPAGDGEDAIVELLVDPSDPMAAPMVGGLLQKVGMTAAPELIARRGLEAFGRIGGPFTLRQRAAIASMQQALGPAAGPTGPTETTGPTGPTETTGATGTTETTNATGVATDPSSESAPDDSGGATSDGAANTASADTADAAPPFDFGGLIPTRTVDVLGEHKPSGLISYYAAGTAVMFLLFSMSGAAGTILEEEEAGTLERVLGSGVGVTRLLASKWAFFTLLGIVQIVTMFLWGAIFFRLELFAHLPGFAVMTVVTAAAAAAFGLVLAGLCRTRTQLSGLATVIILIMSAVGGSMFPRRFLPEWARDVGNATFNAWAVDGYEKIFWYEQPTWTIWPQVSVLVGLTLVFLMGARLLARRWSVR